MNHNPFFKHIIQDIKSRDNKLFRGIKGDETTKCLVNFTVDRSQLINNIIFVDIYKNGKRLNQVRIHSNGYILIHSITGSQTNTVPIAKFSLLTGYLDLYNYHREFECERFNDKSIKFTWLKEKIGGLYDISLSVWGKGIMVEIGEYYYKFFDVA